MASVDWKTLADTAGDGGFDAIPSGDYDIKCVSAEKAQTANGKLMFKAKFEVMSGPFAKRLLWQNFVVSPESEQAMGIFFRQMAAFGMTKDWFRNNPSEDAIVNTLQGRAIRAKVGIRKYNDEDRNEIKAFAPLPTGSAPPPPTGATQAAAPPPPPPPAAAAPAVAPPPPPAPAPAPAPEPAPAPAPEPVAAAVEAPAEVVAESPAPPPADTTADIPIPPPPSF